MDFDKFVLNKLSAGRIIKVNKGQLEESLCYFYKTFGYEQTLNMPIPVFYALIKYINKTEGKKDKKESKGKR